MQRFFLASLLFLGTALVSCAPRTQATTMTAGTPVGGVTVKPVLYKVSPSAAVGQSVTVQGRFLGGAKTAVITLGAEHDGSGGYRVPETAVTNWTDSEITFTVPANAPVGGSWLFVTVGDQVSNGLTFSIKQ